MNHEAGVLPPHAPRDGFHKLPVAITLPFPIGAILIGPFPGMSVKEKAICGAGLWLWSEHTQKDSIFSLLPLLLSFPSSPSPPS